MIHFSPSKTWIGNMANIRSEISMILVSYIITRIHICKSFFYKPKSKCFTPKKYPHGPFAATPKTFLERCKPKSLPALSPACFNAGWLGHINLGLNRKPVAGDAEKSCLVPLFSLLSLETNSSHLPGSAIPKGNLSSSNHPFSGANR